MKIEIQEYNNGKSHARWYARRRVVNVNTKEALDILGVLQDIPTIGSFDYEVIVNSVLKLDKLAVNYTLDEALNSGDGTYKP